MVPPCADVYPRSFPWLAGLLLFFSLVTTIGYTAFYTNTVHLVGVYLFVLVLCVFVFVWNIASVLAMYRTPLRTSLVLFSLALVLTVVIAGTTLALYVKDMDYMSHAEFVMVAVVIATSLVSIVLLGALVAVFARFKPSPRAVCRPFPQKRRRISKA